MITALRNTLKDGGMLTVVWIIVGSMIIGSALPLIMKKKSEGWALRVNGTEIPFNTYAAELAMARDYISTLRAQYGQFADYLLQSMGISDPQAITVQQLVTNQLMVDSYEKQGIVISPQSVAHKLSDMHFVEKQCSDLLPSFLYKGATLDTAMLKLYLQRRNMTAEQLEKRLQERIGSVFMQKALQALVYIPKASVSDAEFNSDSIKDIAVVRFSLDNFKKIVSPDLVNEAKIQEFYNQENARERRYYTPEERTGEVWCFKPDTYGIVIDNKEIEAYYEQHKLTRYIQEPGSVEVRAAAFPTQQEAEQARIDILNSTYNMITLSKEHPFDEKSGKNNGILDPIKRGVGDRIIEKAAFILTYDGDLSSVLSHKNRFVILERVRKVDATFKALSHVKEEIATQLKASRFKEVCTRDLQELTQNANNDTINQFSKEHKGVYSTLRTTQEDAKTDSAQALFSLDLLHYTVVMQGSDCCLVYLKTIIPTEIQPLDTIKTQVRSDLVNNIAKKLLGEAKVSFLRQAHADGIRELAAARGYSFEQYTGIAVTDNEKMASLRKQGIDSAVLNKLEKPGTYTLVPDNEDIILIFLEHTTQKQNEPSESKKKTILASLLKREADTINGAYIASLYRDAKIEKNDILALLDEENTI